MKFDAHRSAYPSSQIGEWLATFDATDHAAAKKFAAQRFPGFQVVVLPHRKHDPALERALRAQSARLSKSARRIKRDR